MSTAEPITLPWSRVQHTADRIAVIASGPSLRDVELAIPPGITTIAVNAAIEHYAADFFFTLDLSCPKGDDRGNIARLLDPRPGTVYYAAAHAAPEHTLPPKHRRPPGATHVRWLQRLGREGTRRMPASLSDDPSGVYGSNSGFGALNLAYLMVPYLVRDARIALLGIDAGPDSQGRGYAWGSGSPGSLQTLPGLFAAAAWQLGRHNIAVVTGSRRSKVTAFPRMQPQEALDWLAE